MNTTAKAILAATLTTALAFGFLHLALPGTNFERLHIFLFNLVGGGTAIIIYTRRERRPSVLTIIFYLLALAYAMLSFLRLYTPAIIIALCLAMIVESVRIRRFSPLPTAFFRSREPAAEKFHQAALLCLSMGLLVSGLVIMNNEHLHLITAPKLTLDVFFLGFSFPVSLITMSVMFGLMEGDDRPTIRAVKNACFWLINLGVITFFIFILAGVIYAELFMSVLLFMTVLVIFTLYVRFGRPLQSKAFLTSGALFLITTAVTGIAFIVLYLSLAEPPGVKLLLRVHAFASLYGWNLNGLVVMARHDDFPLRLHRPSVIGLHWVIVFLAAPLGLFYWPAAILCTTLYLGFLLVVFFSPAGTVQ